MGRLFGLKWSYSFYLTAEGLKIPKLEDKWYENQKRRDPINTKVAFRCVHWNFLRKSKLWEFQLLSFKMIEVPILFG